jgi:hypothetical protein
VALDSIQQVGVSIELAQQAAAHLHIGDAGQ